jgi:hypothetical protein
VRGGEVRDYVRDISTLRIVEKSPLGWTGVKVVVAVENDDAMNNAQS